MCIEINCIEAPYVLSLSGPVAQIFKKCAVEYELA